MLPIPLSGFTSRQVSSTPRCLPSLPLSRAAALPVTLLMPHKGEQWLKGLCPLSALDYRPFSIVSLLCDLDLLPRFFVDCSLNLKIFSQLYHHSNCISPETTTTTNKTHETT